MLLDGETCLSYKQIAEVRCPPLVLASS